MDCEAYPDEMFDAAEKAHNHLTLTHEEMLEEAERRERSNRIIQMNLTQRQLILLTAAITLLYDEVAKTTTPEMKQEIMELSKIIQDASMEKQI